MNLDVIVGLLFVLFICCGAVLLTRAFRMPPEYYDRKREREAVIMRQLKYKEKQKNEKGT
ncbi:hypothetical protein [Chitinivibrio alkaliphilus]|uniref:hypothetical protein n=1 Tax=Chitinivibrio alkaliphilus TaxID=1505232 RepID=UPI00041A5B6E|nr:hypothetical protein [Chitinivibrio alkaliphilus]